MSGAAGGLPVAWPGGRALLGWWRDLAPVRPRRLWFAHLPLHRVEALVEVARPSEVGPLERGALQALALPGPGPELHLAPAVLDLALRALAGQGLAVAGAGGWELTEAGRRALAGELPAPTARQRRTFYFAEAGEPGPLFLPLLRCGTPFVPPEGWHFDAGVLREAIARPPEWKAAHGFPPEVLALLAGGDWSEVIVDRAEQLLLALAEVEGGLVGFAVRPDDWSLQREAPALRLGEGGAAALGDLLAEPGDDAWRQAWQVWCLPRSLPAAEVAECKLERADHRLVVRAPGRLVERLRAARSDAVKGEAWLLAGRGRARAAGLVELVEA